MLSLTLRAPGVNHEIGSLEWIEFRGAELRTSVHPVPIARYEGGRWTHAGLRLALLECRGLLTVHFEDEVLGRGPILGPYPAMRVREAYAFGGRARIAKLSSAGRWARSGGLRDWGVLRALPTRGSRSSG